MYSGGDCPVQRAPQTCDSTNTPKAYQFCFLSSGLLRAVQTDGTTVYGLAVADGTSSATASIVDYPFGTTLYPQDVRNTFFLVNITDGSGTVGSGTTTQAAVSVGTSYALIYGTTGYTDVQMLDASDTTNKFFTVVAKYAEDATADFNGRVIASIASTVTIQ